MVQTIMPGMISIYDPMEVYVTNPLNKHAPPNGWGVRFPNYVFDRSLAANPPALILFDRRM